MYTAASATFTEEEELLFGSSYTQVVKRDTEPQIQESDESDSVEGKPQQNDVSLTKKRKYDNECAKRSCPLEQQSNANQLIADAFLRTVQLFQNSNKDKPLGRALRILVIHCRFNHTMLKDILKRAAVLLFDNENKKVARVLNNLANAENLGQYIIQLTKRIKLANSDKFVSFNNNSPVDYASIKRTGFIKSTQVEDKNKSGFVYFLYQNNTTNNTVDEYTVKVGFSHNPKERFKTLRNDSVHELVVLGVLFCMDCNEMETWFHLQLQRYKIRGEWYRLESRLLGQILTLTQAWNDHRYVETDISRMPHERLMLLRNGGFSPNSQFGLHKAVSNTTVRESFLNFTPSTHKSYRKHESVFQPLRAFSEDIINKYIHYFTTFPAWAKGRRHKHTIIMIGLVDSPDIVLIEKIGVDDVDKYVQHKQIANTSKLFFYGTCCGEQFSDLITCVQHYRLRPQSAWYRLPHCVLGYLLRYFQPKIETSDSFECRFNVISYHLFFLQVLFSLDILSTCGVDESFVEMNLIWFDIKRYFIFKQALNTLMIKTKKIVDIVHDYILEDVLFSKIMVQHAHDKEPLCCVLDDLTPKKCTGFSTR